VEEAAKASFFFSSPPSLSLQTLRSTSPYIGWWDEPRPLDQTDLMDEDLCSSKAIGTESTRLLLIGLAEGAGALIGHPDPRLPRLLLRSGGFLILLDASFSYLASIFHFLFM